MLTHRRNNADDFGVHHILFAEGGNDHYGDCVWVLRSELPEISDELRGFAADFYCAAPEAIEDELDPADIVDTAGVWDDEDFVAAVLEQFGPGGVRTHDGAVVWGDYEDANIVIERV